MKEESIYQQALAKAIEQTANGQMAVTEYITRLARLKAQQAYDGCIGRTFNSDDLKCEVMAVAVGYHVKTKVWDMCERYDNNQKEVIQVRIAFVADVTPLLESKRKQLTDAERKKLKELNSYRKWAQDAKKSRWYRSYADDKDFMHVKDLGNELRDLKGKLKVVDTAYWSWDLSDIMSDKFLIKGLAYDAQSICDNEDE